MTADPRAFAPATQRNRDAILQVLAETLPNRRLPDAASGDVLADDAPLVLEIGSGTGEHVVHFARHLPALRWQPSETSEAALPGIQAWIVHTGLSTIAAPFVLDVNRTPWPVQRADAVMAINVIHYSPWESTAALLRGAAAVLPEGGVLYLYGPYTQGGRHTAASNLAFDGWLKARDPAFGVRDLDVVAAAADHHGLMLDRVVEMPANNLSVVFRKTIRSLAPN